MTILNESTAHVPHGIVFICDPIGEIDVPPDTGAGPFLKTDTCLSLWVRHEVDGPVHFQTYHDGMVSPTSCHFIGIIQIQSGRVVIEDSSGTTLIGMECPAGLVEVQIYTNHPKDPTHVVVAFRQV